MPALQIQRVDIVRVTSCIII